MNQIRIVKGKCYNQNGYGCRKENTYDCMRCANYAGETAFLKRLGGLYELDAKNRIRFEER